MKLRYGLTLNEYEFVEGEDRYYRIEIKNGDTFITSYNMPIYEQSEPSTLDVIERIAEELNKLIK